MAVTAVTAGMGRMSKVFEEMGDVLVTAAVVGSRWTVVGCSWSVMWGGWSVVWGSWSMVWGGWSVMWSVVR